MKNALEYYYDLVIDNIHQKDKRYIFKKDNYYYCLIQCQNRINEITDIYELSNYLLSIRIYNHQIILNKDNNIVTYINNNPYILLKMFDEMNKKITLQDIITYNKIYIYYFQKLKFNDWKGMWIKKIDYFEYQVNQLGKQYPNIRKSFSYFVGLSENAIALLNEIEFDDNLVLSHRRLRKNSTLFDLYNPLNFILDNRVRDIADYFKDNITNENVDSNSILSCCNDLKFTEKEWKLFFVRMLFPTFYFDIYENIINNEKNDDELINIINIIPKYELVIKKLYEYISSRFTMPNIEWLKKS